MLHCCTHKDYIQHSDVLTILDFTVSMDVWLETQLHVGFEPKGFESCRMTIQFDTVLVLTLGISWIALGTVELGSLSTIEITRPPPPIDAKMQ